MNASPAVYGLAAEFSESEKLMTAARRAYESGYRNLDAFTPFPVEGLAEILGRNPSKVPLIVLMAGITGAAGGYFMEWYAMAVSYPINVGGRPLSSWPPFIPITFELTILSAALAAILAMFILNRLPQPYHPVFNVPDFERASTDRFFLCIEASDALFNPDETRRFMESLFPDRVTEVLE